MRTLPFESNADLVALVVKNTLASMEISVQDIIQEAVARQESIKVKMAAMHAAIGDLEAQLRLQREEMAACDAEMAEATACRKRLELVAGREETPKTAAPRVVGRGAGEARSDGPPTIPPTASASSGAGAKLTIG